MHPRAASLVAVLALLLLAAPALGYTAGVNVGGLFVLEPWITPSLFYRFLGHGRGAVAFDTFSFCQVLGPAAGRRALDAHAAAWLSRADLEAVKAAGVDTVRLPVGDWLLAPCGCGAVGCEHGRPDPQTSACVWEHFGHRSGSTAQTPSQHH